MLSDDCLSLEQAKSYIDALDFSQIIDKMVKKDKWFRKDAVEACNLYRNFLFLNKKYQGQYQQLPPSLEIDEFWHNHILDTEKYQTDCEAIFGKFMHHYPYFGIDKKTTMDDLHKAFQQVQALHYKEFGFYIYGLRRNKFLNFLRLMAEKIKKLKWGKWKLTQLNPNPAS